MFRIGFPISNTEAVNDPNLTIISMSSNAELVEINLEKTLAPLKEGNNDRASIPLNDGYRFISTVSEEVKVHYEGGMKALSIGDLNGALKHLKSAINEMRQAK